MGKTRDLFKKIRDTTGTFHAKMGSIKDKNGMDLTEAKDIKKRWQEYTEELYKKDLHGKLDLCLVQIVRKFSLILGLICVPATSSLFSGTSKTSS